MRYRGLLGLILLTMLLTGCTLPGFSGGIEPVPTLIVSNGTVVVVPGIEQGVGEETATPIPTGVATAVAPVLVVTAAPVVIITPSIPIITPNAVDVNCRSGPDLAYASASVIPLGGTAVVAGRTADSSWWYVHDPNNPAGFCWVAADVVSIAGPTSDIPVQALPAAIVNQVTVAVTGPPAVVCGGAKNVLTFSGSISTTGAATVQFQWELTGSATNTSAPQALAFTGAGTQNVAGPAALGIDCGNYTITLHVTSPNDISASKSFTVANP